MQKIIIPVHMRKSESFQSLSLFSILCDDFLKFPKNGDKELNLEPMLIFFVLGTTSPAAYTLFKQWK